MENPNQLIEEAKKELNNPTHDKYKNRIAYEYGVVSMTLAIQLAEALDEIENLKQTIKNDLK